MSARLSKRFRVAGPARTPFLMDPGLLHAVGGATISLGGAFPHVPVPRTFGR
jgi:hypothetical protein